MNLFITFVLVPLVIILEFIVVPALVLKKSTKISYINNYPVFMINSNEINAYSLTSIWGKFIVISKGLILNEDKNHVYAAIAHELGHIKLNHHLKMNLFIVMVIVIFSFLISYPILLIPFTVFALILQRYISRTLELNADKYAVKMTKNKQLLEELIIKYNDRKTTFLSTHPNIQARLKNINNVK